MNRRLLVLYPRSWRERYGDEVVALADELVRGGETTPRRAALDLIAGAAVERCRVLIRRAVLLPIVALGVVVAGVALAVSRAPARPYFATHPVGALIPVAESIWMLMELGEWRRGRRSRRSAGRQPRTARRRFWLAVGGCVLAATLSVNLAPSLVPAARIRPGVVAFAVGVVILAGGLGLRGWSFRALRGRYLNFSAVVEVDQPVVTAGPYRLLRHPGSAGLLLICAGLGLTSANWAGLAAMTVLPLLVVVWRIRTEEQQLLTSVGAPYRRYARDHKRLLPLIW